MPRLRSHIVAAKERLADGLREFKRRHQAGCLGVELCAAVAGVRDTVLREVFEAALEDLAEVGPGGLRSQVALVAHGGYGRGDVAPYSDVDLMILRGPRSADRVAPLAKRLLRDVFDSGLVLGHSVRTPEQACRLACADPSICTSLIESRLLAGDARLFELFGHRFRRQVRQRAQALTTAIERARLEERARYGETVFLLEPDIKRSRGTLRDLQLVRWIGFARYGTNDPRELRSMQILSEEDHQVLVQAGEFLLRLRNEMHLHGGRATDVLDRTEQLRIAEVFGYQPAAGMLPVELFMRDYFRHTSRVSHVVTRFVAKARSRDRLSRVMTAAFGHRVEGGVRVGPAGLMVTREALKLMRGNLTEIMRLVGLANLYDKPISPATWEAIRREAGRLPDTLPAEACRRFVSLLAHPTIGGACPMPPRMVGLGPLLRDLHETSILQRFIPEYEHARGLLQFNQYHKYTVDDHCLWAVEFATRLASDPGPLGRAYRRIAQKHVLHLALLIHDLGKGFLEDHRQVGAKIAERAAARLGLTAGETQRLRFLVQKHMLMNHLAFRRDTSDEQLAVRFAVQVGSPELLRMLFVLTAADLAAVGPGVWDGWKEQIVTDLYHRTMQHLAADLPSVGHGAHALPSHRRDMDMPRRMAGRATIIDEQLRRRRDAVRTSLGAQMDHPWFARQLDALPTGYLGTTEPKQVAADLRLLSDLKPGQTTARAQYGAETETLQFTIGTWDDVTPGVFHKLTGVLSSHALQIRSAEINTLADGLVLDRFWVHDPDYAGEPPPERLEEVKSALIRSLHDPRGQPPSFRRTWRAGRHSRVRGPGLPTRVSTDNTTSDRYTILDIFAHDRTGLLYAVARTLFELGLSVWRAKIGTHLDQVVDVFYVTDRQDHKIKDPQQLEEIRRRLLQVINALEDE